MIVRRNFLPKTLLDITCCSILVFGLIPYIYWFELYIVMPYFYKTWSFWFSCHWICGNFIALNIVTNLIALILCDTSVKGKVMPTTLEPGWRFCSVCESVVPPRSWHCKICQTCILKRDHHCVFAGCCVGHANYRYFLMFVLYTFISLVYVTYYNSYYLWEVIDFTKVSWINIIFPLAMIFFQFTIQQFLLLLHLLLIIAGIFCGILLLLHISFIKHGQVMHERGLNIFIYNQGPMNNFIGVVGKKWYVAWICPFIVSELPDDGIHWKIREVAKTK